MKKIKSILLILLLMIFIPCLVNAETCEPDKVTISSITINDKTDNVTEKKEPVISGRTLGLDLKMGEVGDTIEYKMVVKNDSKEDYELDKTSLSASSDYIDYTFDTKDNSNIVKAGEVKEVLLRVQYKNEVSSDSFVDGVYHDSKNLQVNLSTNNENNILDTIKNPKTGVQVYLLILLISITICTTIYIILKKKKTAKLMILIIGVTVIIPISTYAICKCDIKINSSVEIIREEAYFKIREHKCERSWEQEATYIYRKGMTFNDYINSNYYKNLSEEDKYLIDELLKISNDPEEWSSNYDSTVEYKELSICINNVKRPEWKPNMSQEENNIYEEEMNNARIQTEKCYEDYKKIVNLTDKILDVESAIYTPDLANNCPD